jgi:glycerophosphoryl diester phosphodiesterase
MKKPLIIGHRGSIVQGPENTLSSFKKAIESGIDMIELDVRLSKDDHLVIMHDESVYRTTNGKGFIGSLTLKQIKKLRINKTEKVPTLQEAVNLIKGKCMINIHVKEYKAADKILELIDRNKIHDDVLVSSFSERTIKHIKSKNPEIKTGYLFRRPILLYIALAKRTGADALHPHHKLVTRRFVKKAHDNGLEINVWPIKNKETASKLKRFGVDGLIINSLGMIK